MNKFRSITIIALERSSKYYTKKLSLSSHKKKFIILDLVEDPCNWKYTQIVEVSGGVTIEKCSAYDLHGLKSKLLKYCEKINGRKVVFIDSIMILLNYDHSTERLVSFINELGNSIFSSLFVVKHQDLSNEEINNIIDSVANCLIEMTKINYETKLKLSGSFKILQKRKTGKVSKAFEHYSVSSNGILFYTDSQVIIKTPISSNFNSNQIDQLTPEQQFAKASVILPYMKAQKFASQSVSGLPENTLDQSNNSIIIDDEDDNLVNSDDEEAF